MLKGNTEGYSKLDRKRLRVAQSMQCWALPVGGTFTCRGPDRSPRGLHHISVDGLRPWFPLFSPRRTWFDKRVHVLHKLQLFSPKVLLFDKFPSGFVFFLLHVVFLCFQSVEKDRHYNEGEESRFSDWQLGWVLPGLFFFLLKLRLQMLFPLLALQFSSQPFLQKRCSLYGHAVLFLHIILTTCTHYQNGH